MKVFAILVLLALSKEALSVDNEYCSLNMSPGECTSQTTNSQCCWLVFSHERGYDRDVKGCFDYRFMVNSLKFIVKPKGFDTMSDAQLCDTFGMSCSEITRDNFKAFMEKVPQQKEKSFISKVSTLQCHQ